MAELVIRNPFDQSIIEVLHETPQAEVAEKFRACSSAQKQWAKHSVQDRASILSKLLHLLRDDVRTERLAKLMTKETGKPIAISRVELQMIPSRISWLLENTAIALRPAASHFVPEEKVEERVVYEPLGVCAILGPFNFPLLIGLDTIVSALVTGNSVVYKPSELSTLCGLELAKLFEDIDLPQHLFQIVIGGASVGAALLKQPIRAVLMNGSVQTGRKIAELVAPNFVKQVLELGGNDAVYIADDFPAGEFERAATSISESRLVNSGQNCSSIQRVYVHNSVYDPFVEKLKQVFSQYKMGDPMEEDTFIGPLRRKEQVIELTKQICDAVAKGAIVSIGYDGTKERSDLAENTFFEPTLLENCAASMSVMHEESFGPLLAVQRVSSDAEALELMNDSMYGLTGGIFCKSEERAMSFLHELQVGTAYWNTCERNSPSLPWPTRKLSGCGVMLGLNGLRELVQPKAIHMYKKD